MAAFSAPSRHSGALAHSERTRNLEIPGSRCARPGMTTAEGNGPSSRFRLRRERRKRATLGGEALEQRRRLQRGIVGLLGVIRQPVGDVLEADLVGIEHRAAAVDRPAIAIEPDYVDVARTRRDALFEDARTLVDHRVHHALQDFVVADDALLAAETLQGLVDQLFDLGIGQRRARAALILVVALAGLLAEAAGFAQRVGDFRLDAAVLARAPADIE